MGLPINCTASYLMQGRRWNVPDKISKSIHFRGGKCQAEPDH